MKFFPVAALMLSSVALSACMTQAPAQVVMKGNNFYGTPEASLTRVASAPPKRVSATPSNKPAMTMPTLASRDSERSYEPRPSYGYSAPSNNTTSRTEVAQVTVKDLEPITASTTSAPKAVEPVEVAEVSAPAVEKVKAPEVLPEPQARVVAESKTLKDTPVNASASGFIWPVKGTVISEYGAKSGGEYNDGINIAARAGEPIVAAADGEVVYSGNELRGYGNMVIIRHEDGIMSAYAHADRILVSKGERVEQGVTIATVGQSGGVEQAQLHFGVRKNKEPVDPMSVLSGSSLAAR